MPKITLSDGSAFELIRVNDIQLKTRHQFVNASARTPQLIEIVRIDGIPIASTKLVVGDPYGIWSKHQTDQYIDTSPLRNVLSGTERQEARKLFARIVGVIGAIDASSAKPNAPLLHAAVLTWFGKHIGQIITGVIVTVLVTLIVKWLGAG
jgi:hypothetical protein